MTDRAEDLVAYHHEVMWAGANYSTQSGARIAFYVGGLTELEFFEGKTKHTGKKPGTRFLMTLVELGDDGLPINQRKLAAVVRATADMKGGELAKLAGILCKSREFLLYVVDRGWDNPTEDGARDFILKKCGIASRRELDHDSKAAQRFHELIRKPYREWTEGVRDG
jgi:hypothetical protein